MRNQALDIMKAIGIILVIIGHNTSGIAYHYIYSFHMPMFFIIAGYLWKVRSIGQSLKHDLKRILAPYLVYLSIVAIVDCICSGLSFGRIEQNALKMIWGSVMNVDVFGHHVQGVGYIWFLPALYVCKNVFNALYIVWWKVQNTTFSRLGLGVCVFVCMFAGVMIHKYLFPLPFAITTGLNALGFFSIGYLLKVWLKDIEILNKVARWYKLFIMVVYASLGWYTLNGMGTCDYSILPLDYVAGITGTVICFYVSQWLCFSTKYISKAMQIIGQYTISILIIHQFIAAYAWVLHIENTNHNLLISLTIGVALMYVFIHYTISKIVTRNQ